MKQTQWATRLIFLAFGLGISSWAPMVPFAKERLALDDAQLGMVLFIFGFGALVSMPLTGWLVNRFGSRCMTLYSGLVVSILLPFLTIAASPFSLSAVLFLFGAATGATNVSINAQAIAVESKSCTPLMSGFHCLFSTGGLFGALIVSFLLEINWPLPLCAAAVSTLMVALLISQWKHLLREEDHQTINENDRFSLPGMDVIFLGGICFISFMAEGSMLNWSAEFLRSSRNYDPSIAGIGYALFSIAMALGRFAGDRLVKRFTIVKVFQAGTILAAIGFLFVVYAEMKLGGLLGFCLIGFGASNVVPILFSAAGRISSTKPKIALTIVTTLGYTGLLIGPVFIGFLAEATSLSTALASLALCLWAVGVSGRWVLAAPSYQKA